MREDRRIDNKDTVDKTVTVSVKADIQLTPEEKAFIESIRHVGPTTPLFAGTYEEFLKWDPSKGSQSNTVETD